MPFGLVLEIFGSPLNNRLCDFFQKLTVANEVMKESIAKIVKDRVWYSQNQSCTMYLKFKPEIHHSIGSLYKQ